jgi:hypothetical protein
MITEKRGDTGPVVAKCGVVAPLNRREPHDERETERVSPPTSPSN